MATKTKYKPSPDATQLANNLDQLFRQRHTMHDIEYEIDAMLRPYRSLRKLCIELDMEMDGVAPIPKSAAACLNGIRSRLKEMSDSL